MKYRAVSEKISRFTILLFFCTQFALVLLAYVYLSGAEDDLIVF
ncbi:hypothetical protein HMPREF2532_04234 [Bacteroides ovatus]|nr:hypothetical protein HMPREF2532_04234 [Bacteroides ovatus]CDM01262.1 hypothetical protein BN891_41930 [Bacteroides xylanisolvens SD CC 2a]